MRDPGPLHLSQEDIERLLSGKTPAGRPDLADLAGLLGDAPQALRKQPSDRTGHEHLTAIVSATERLDGVTRPETRVDRTSVEPRWRRVVNRTKLLVLRVSAGAGAALLALTGYAYAGGELPGGAEAAVEQILQIELPDGDGEDKGRSGEVREVRESFGDERGCAFGQAVAEAASGKTDRTNDPCTKADEKTNNGQSDEAHGKGAGKSGENKPEDTPKGSKSTGEEKSGEHKPEDTPKGGKSTGEEKSGQNKPEDTPKGGKSTGEEKSGQNKPEPTPKGKPDGDDSQTDTQ